MLYATGAYAGQSRCTLVRLGQMGSTNWLRHQTGGIADALVFSAVTATDGPRSNAGCWWTGPKTTLQWHCKSKLSFGEQSDSWCAGLRANMSAVGQAYSSSQARMSYRSSKVAAAVTLDAWCWVVCIELQVLGMLCLLLASAASETVRPSRADSHTNIWMIGTHCFRSHLVLSASQINSRIQTSFLASPNKRKTDWRGDGGLKIWEPATLDSESIQAHATPSHQIRKADVLEIIHTI